MACFIHCALLGSSRAESAQSSPPVDLVTSTADVTNSFTAENVVTEARRLATRGYTKPGTLKLQWLPKNYDDYRRLQLRRESAVWATKPPHFEIHPFPAGWLFDHAVDISIVENGVMKDLNLAASDFIDTRVTQGPDTPLPVVMPLSGFRINGPLNSPAVADEIIAFQGATYFRALGKGQGYGLSARGLASGTAAAGGEEFPEFRKFWIVKPLPSDSSITIYALLDSPSTTGAYRFTITPGEETVIDVAATLFPRQELRELGLAPLTSMFLLGPSNPTRIEDFRPRVHDSDGLAILNGNGERIWRPIANPRSLQVSSFIDRETRGFGLIQRFRQFSGYEDLEARYERRPSLWVEPTSGFGKGNVVLVEIPTEEEIHDNVVAFFRPASTVKANQPLTFSYRLRWRDDTPTKLAGPWVASTRVGRIYSRQPRGYRFVVDYVDENRPITEPPVPVVYASAGRVADTAVHANPETGGFRVTFVLYPEGAELAELRLDAGQWGGRTAETWLYRWTPQK